MPWYRALSHLLPSHVTRRTATTCFSKMSPRGTREAPWHPLRAWNQAFCSTCSTSSTLPQTDTPVVPTFPTQEPPSQTLILAFHPLPWLIVTLRQTPEEHLLCILRASKRAQLDARIKDNLSTESQTCGPIQQHGQGLKRPESWGFQLPAKPVLSTPPWKLPTLMGPCEQGTLPWSDAGVREVKKPYCGMQHGSPWLPLLGPA